ncbi:MAG TPA: hypothetical protein VH835_10460 [Dongiaceae bacterium]|jgi:hypothetical protein
MRISSAIQRYTIPSAAAGLLRRLRLLLRSGRSPAQSSHAKPDRLTHHLQRDIGLENLPAGRGR